MTPLILQARGGGRRREGRMATSFINDPEHWHNRAEEARTLAEQMNE